MDNNQISSSGILIKPFAGSGVTTPAIQLGGKPTALGTDQGMFIGQSVFLSQGFGISIGDTDVVGGPAFTGTNNGGFIAASGQNNPTQTIVAFGEIGKAYQNSAGNSSYFMYRPSTGLVIQHPNFSVRDGQLQISSSGNRPTNIKLASDGVSTGIELDSVKGLIGHGDLNSHAFETHDGNFQFGENTLSVPGGGGGAEYDVDGTLSSGGTPHQQDDAD